MLSKSVVRRLQEGGAYPRCICEDCSVSAGGKELPVDGTSWSAHCDVCLTFRVVNNPIVLGCPSLQLGKKQLARLKDQG